MIDENLTIFNCSICQPPVRLGQRVLLCDEMWQTLDNHHMHVLQPFKHMLRHTVHSIPNQGDKLINGEYLQILDDQFYDLIQDISIFVRFRATFIDLLSDFDKVLTQDLSLKYQSFSILGWEVWNNVGCSASYEGIYPLTSYSDFFYIKHQQNYCTPINQWGLFDSLDLANDFCTLNNQHNPDDAPWIPIAILTDTISSKKLKKVYDNT